MPAIAKHTLSSIRVNELTLCRKGKVPGAEVTLFKAVAPQAVGDTGGDKPLEAALARDKLDDLWDGWSAFQDSIVSTAASDLEPEKRKAALVASLDQFKAYLDGKVDSLVAKAAQTLVAKGGGAPGGGASAGPAIGEDVIMDTMEKLTKALEGAAGEITELKAKLAKAEETIAAGVTPAPGASTPADLAKAAQEAIFKGMSPEAVALVKGIEQRAIASEVALAKMADETAQNAAITKASELVGGLPTDAATLGKTLHAIGKADPALAAEVERLLKAAGAQAAAGGALLTQSAGTASPVAKGSAEGMLAMKASEIKKANPALTDEKAFAKAMVDNPTLYSQYLVETRGNVVGG